jgi:type I restriction enzyme S subunit
MSVVLDEVIAAAQLVPLSHAVEVNPKLDRSSLNDDLDVSFVPMAAVEPLSGGIDVSTVRKYAEVKKGYTHFRDGDILFAKVTPCMENGKMAVARKLVNGVGFGSTEFHVLRPRADVDARYIYYFVSSQTFRKEASGHMTGAVGLRRVPSAYLEEQLIPLPGIERQREIVAELEKQFSRLDEAVANLQRVKANLQRYEKSTIESLTSPETFDECFSGTVADIAISLDNMRKPVNKAERATRQGNVPYLGANGQTGWIDDHLFDEEIVLVVEDETFVGRTAPFCYYFAGKCWVNNHTHVLRAKPGVVSPKYLNLALSYYPFIPLTTGSTGRRKLTKGALMVAPIVVPSLAQQKQIVLEVERRLSLTSGVLAEVKKSLQRSGKLRQAVLATAFGIKSAQPEH